MRQSRLLQCLGVMTLLSVAFASAPVDPVEAARRGPSSGSSCLPGVLKTRLSQIRARFGRVRVISTFRRGARIAGSGRRSLHASCRAVDFHVPRGKYRAVVSWLKRNHFGGVGTYSCGMHHIHIDNGPRVRFHHCVNGRGRPTRYAKRRRSRKYASKSRRSRKYASKTRRSSRRYASRRRSSKANRRLPVARKPMSMARRFANNLGNGGS